MKKQFVEALQEGDVVNDYFVAIRKDLREQPNGGKFLGMVFKDRTGEIGGILWSGAANVARMFEVGDVVNVRGNVASHQDRLQIRVEQVLPLREQEYDACDLVLSTGDLDTAAEKYRETLLSVQNPWLKSLIERFLADDEVMGLFRVASAGRKWHHSCRGGLLQHCREMTVLALAACEIFPMLDRDLLVTAIFLHDIGKVEEMSHGLVVDYTTEGKLIGHLCLGADLVRRKIDEVPDFPRELALQLLHCLLSHHGSLNHGSPVVPKTLEALVLYHCDNLDAQTDAFLRLIEETRERGLAWSDYVPSIDRQVWTKDR
jgi:3'-5' exoribonuclease